MHHQNPILPPQSILFLKPILKKKWSKEEEKWSRGILYYLF